MQFFSRDRRDRLSSTCILAYVRLLAALRHNRTKRDDASDDMIDMNGYKATDLCLRVYDGCLNAVDLARLYNATPSQTFQLD